MLSSWSSRWLLEVKGIAQMIGDVQKLHVSVVVAPQVLIVYCSDTNPSSTSQPPAHTETCTHKHTSTSGVHFQPQCVYRVGLHDDTLLTPSAGRVRVAAAVTINDL